MASMLDAGPDLGQPHTPRSMADAKTTRALQIVARSLSRLGRECARAAGEVTPQQADALQLIGERGVVSTSALALLLGIDPSTASRNLAGLERCSFVVRRRGAEDGRQTDVRLTQKGKRTAEAVTTERAARSALCSTASLAPSGNASPTRST
jgi:DNA-binding MarR family transcriptional regulator